MKVVITGANSGIGKKLCIFLTERGVSIHPLMGRQSEVWRLGDRLPENIEADVLIHLAHDRNNSLEENLSAMRQIADSFQGRLILLSSMSAHSRSRSVYGQSKFQSEKLISKLNSCSIRAGIIYGPGVEGFLDKLTRFVLRLPVIPLPFSGKTRVWTTHYEDLLQEIWIVMNTNTRGVILGANNSSKSLLDFMQVLSKDLHKKRLFITFSPHISIALIWLWGRISANSHTLDSLKSSINEVSYKDLRALKSPATKFRPYLLK